jgi:ABC-type Fe3+ transport system substrate-binding protein
MKPNNSITLIRASVAVGAAAVLFAGTLSSGEARTVKEIINYRGADRQQMLIEGAKKEGQVLWYSSATAKYVLEPMKKAFQKKYPFIKYRYFRANSRKVNQKVFSEMRAGVLAADVISGTGTTMPMIKAGVPIPFYTPEMKAFPKEYLHPQRLYVPTRFSYFSFTYNTNEIKPADVPKSYDDLLDPKWRGKMGWGVTSNSSGSAIMIINMLTTRGRPATEKYLAAMVKQNVQNLTGSGRNIVNKVARGAIQIGLGTFAHHGIISASKGAPVRSVVLDPVPGVVATIMVAKSVKNPHAAMLLIDYVVGKEGQTLLQQQKYLPSRPDVAPSKVLQSISPRYVGMKENFISPSRLYDLAPEMLGLQKKYFLK